MSGRLNDKQTRGQKDGEKNHGPLYWFSSPPLPPISISFLTSTRLLLKHCISRQPFTEHPIYKGHVPLQLSPLFCSAFLPLERTCLSVSVFSCREHLGQSQVTRSSKYLCVGERRRPWDHHHQPPRGQHEQHSCPFQCRTQSPKSKSQTQVST